MQSTQSKYNRSNPFWHKFLAQGGGIGNTIPPVPNPAIVQSKYNCTIQIQLYNPNTIVQSKYNRHNPNTIDTIQMQSSQSFLAHFWHKGGGQGNTIPTVPNPAILQSKYNLTIHVQSSQSIYNPPNHFWHTLGTKGGVKVILYQLCQIPRSCNPSTILQFIYNLPNPYTILPILFGTLLAQRGVKVILYPLGQNYGILQSKYNRLIHIQSYELRWDWDGLCRIVLIFHNRGLH